MKTVRLVAQPILIAFVMAIGVRSAVRLYAIPSSSMAPTLNAGDHIVVTPYRAALPKRGDVIVFHSPLNADELLVKRIAGVPGDLVEAREGHLIVPADCYFVLGDNTYNSYDSRYWGCVPAANICGRVARIYFPLSRVGVPQ